MNADFEMLKIQSLQCNPVDLFHKTWALVTAGDEQSVNTMTISWGSIGELWGKPVSFTFIRPQRYTKQFVDREATYSLCFFDESYRQKLSYLGIVSGKEENKIEKACLTVAFEDGTPYFEEAQMVLFCKKLYNQQLNSESFLDKALDGQVYAAGDYHTMYISEIISAYKRA